MSEFPDYQNARRDYVCRLCVRERNLRWFYGMTLAQYEERLATQGGVCAICKHPETRRRSDGELFALAVDHDHSCCAGKRTCGRCVRGLLCWECNNILGKVEAKPGMMDGIATYLLGAP